MGKKHEIKRYDKEMITMQIEEKNIKVEEKIEEKTVFTINAKLLFADGETHYFPFTVICGSEDRAETLLEEYLKANIGKHTIKYVDVVGFRHVDCYTAIVDKNYKDCF